MRAGDDLDLRERFAALSDDDAANAPSLGTVLRGRSVEPRSSRFRWIPVAALASAAALTAAVLFQPGGRHEASLDEAIAQAQLVDSWTAPTDAWLTLSGFEIPNSVPSLSFSSVTLPEASTEETPQGESR